MTDQRTREDNFMGRAAFVVCVVGCVLPFAGRREFGDSPSYMGFWVCQGLAMLTGLVGRRSRLGRIAARVAFCLSATVALLALLLLGRHIWIP